MGPLLLTGTALLVAPACGRGASPSDSLLACAEPTVDLGAVHEGSVVEHAFAVEALGPVAVTEVGSDCGCSVARLERETADGPEAYALRSVLEAGERLQVIARYDTRGRRGQSVRTIQIATDRGEPLRLSWTADVRPWLVVEPAELAFQRVREGQGAECAFRVRSVTGETMALRATRRALPPMVSLELRPRAADGEGRASEWECVAHLAVDGPLGTFSWPLEVESDVPAPGAEGRPFSIAPPWSVQVVGPVALTSPSLDFGLMEPDEHLRRSVRIECFDADFDWTAPEARLEPLRPDQPFPLARTASVRVLPVPGLEAYDVEVTLDGLDREIAGNFLARLVVETHHPRLPRLEALVRGVRNPGPQGAVAPGGPP